MIYLLQILYAVLCVVEAKLEQYVISGKRADIPVLIDKEEHRWSAIYMITCGIFLIMPPAMITGNFIQLVVLLIIPVIRRLFFDTALKIFRGLSDHPIHIISGNHFIDKTSRKIFGTHGGVKELAACALLLLLFNYLIVRVL
ncbi:MAG: hypothetical protein M9904_02405 [Chitinophagaceae bacterium]|nr:hypothetical protein [Chitinophagaceae bacterium]